MGIYIAFLRGINVAGQKKVPMAALREILVDAGLNEVKTYIQSGNVVFESKIKSASKLQQLIQKAIEDNFGFKVPTLVKSVNEIEEIIAANPFDSAEYLENNRSYFVLLFESPLKEHILSFETMNYPNEEFHISNNCVYLLCKNGYGNAKLSNNLIERKLKITATARNYRTMQKLLELAS